MSEQEPKLGDLRVWWNRFDSKGIFTISVPNTDVAYGVLLGLATGDLANPNIQMNVGGLEVYEDIDDGEGPSWNEWYDEETGFNIDQYSSEKYPDLMTIN